jgi:hypothetical protein
MRFHMPWPCKKSNLYKPPLSSLSLCFPSRYKKVQLLLDLVSHFQSGNSEDIAFFLFVLETMQSNVAYAQSGY